MDSSKTKILPALPVQFHAPFPSLSRAGKGEVDDRVPGLCPDFWYKLSLTLDLAVKSPFPTPPTGGQTECGDGHSWVW